MGMPSDMIAELAEKCAEEWYGKPFSECTVEQQNKAWKVAEEVLMSPR